MLFPLHFVLWTLLTQLTSTDTHPVPIMLNPDWYRCCSYHILLVKHPASMTSWLVYTLYVKIDTSAENSQNVN